MNVKLEDSISTTVASAPSRGTSSGSRKANSKRTRTKHACDECRRTQKKCDGVKPVCRRCRLNDSPCTYTPHKARRTCACSSFHDFRRHRPLPGVCVAPNDYCSNMSSTDALSVQMGYLGRMHPTRSSIESFRASVVPSQQGERGAVYPRLSYSDSSLSILEPPSPYPIIIPPQTDAQYLPGMNSTFAAPPPFLPPVNASPERRNSIVLPSTHDEFSGSTYLSGSSTAPSLQVSIPVYEDSLHLSSESPESSLLTPYSVVEPLPQDASHSLPVSLARGLANPRPFPEASYQLSPNGAYSYQQLPEPTFISLSQPQTEHFDEQHIQQFGIRPDYMKEHSQPQLPPAAFVDEYLRETPPSHHSSPIMGDDQFPPYPLSVSQESWTNGYSSSSLLRRHSAPSLSSGSEFSGSSLGVHEQLSLAYECYADHY